MTEKQAADLRRSLEKFNLMSIPVVDLDGRIVSGHQRCRILIALGRGDETIDVRIPNRKLTTEEYLEANLRENKNLGEWDFAELANFGEDMLLEVGFEKDELDTMFGLDPAPGNTDPDEVPEPPDEAITQPGDLWILGDHRLLCGDSGSPDDLDRLLAGATIHLVNTDPPYNVNVEPRSNNAIASGSRCLPHISKAQLHHQGFDLARYPEKSKPTTAKMRPKDRPLANDFMSDEDFAEILMAWFGNIARALQPGRAFYIWGGYINCGNYPAPLKINGLKFAQAIIWVKEHPVLGRKDFMSNHEWCFYGWKEGAAHVYLGPNNATDVWSVKKVNPQSMVHLTEKPVELAVRAMQYSCRPGENVLDLFGGSGSTLIGAEQTGRKAFLMELDALYCDVIVTRWENFTGKKAERVPRAEVAQA
jgi:DNA modification methylase